MAFYFTNRELARLLRAVAAAYTVRGENQFRLAAYQRAADSVEHAASEVKDLWDDGKLGELAGIGPSIAGHLDELFKNGKVKHFEEVMAGLPPAMFELLEIPGIGPKTAYQLTKKLKIFNKNNALAQLEKAAKEGKIRLITGFGEKSEKDILTGIEEFKRGQIKEERMLLPYADALAGEMINYLKACPAVIRADPLGSLRRMVSTIGDVDIAVATNEPEKVLDHFSRYPGTKKALGRIILKSGRQVDLRLQNLESYGAMLQYFTGSKHHNIALREFALKKGFSLSEYGIKTKGDTKILRYKDKKILEFETEEAFYNFLGLDWIPPEIREDSGEIEMAQKHSLPKLVTLSQIKGDLHIHSDFAIETSHDEGADFFTNLLETAANLGYQYLGFAEHNPSTSRHSQEEIIAILKRKKAIIEQLNYSSKQNLFVRAINGLEIDIKPNGSLAIPEEALELLDYAIVSIHSNFRMGREEMTKRVIAGLSYPRVKIFGHPTGRKLGKREGYELNWEKIFEFCREKDIWLEISAWPDRLDLPDTLVHEAIRGGVKLIIGSDAHAANHLSLMKYGVSVARRGWAQGKDIVNTWEYAKIAKELISRERG